MAAPKLSNKQKAFCHYYIIDWNATKACVLAGYSEKTAQQIGSENLLKPVIQDYIEDIQKDIAKEAGISMLGQLLDLKKISKSNITGIHKDWITRKDFESLSDDTKAAIQEIDTKIIRKVTNELNTESMEFEKVPYDIEYVKIKLFNKLEAIKEINKMLGFYEPEKIDHNIKTEPPLTLNIDGKKLNL